MNPKKKIRIFLGLSEIAGYYKNLKKGFLELGYDCTFVNLRGHVFEYGGDDVPNALVVIARRIGSAASSAYKSTPGFPLTKLMRVGALLVLEQVVKLPLFFWALFTHDVFIFGFNASFLCYFDLPIMKLFGKKIIYVFHGSDARPPYINGGMVNRVRPMSMRTLRMLTWLIKFNMKIVETFADTVINFAPVVQFNEKKVISGLIIGLPFENTAIETKSSSHTHIQILHAASNPETRGTDKIRKIMNRLKQKGYPIRYIEITGKANNVVLEEIQRSDIIVDELYSDTALAGFGTEAAYFGKPVVVAGYYASFIHKDVPNEYIPPSVFVLPEDVEKTIEQLVANSKMREHIGKQLQTFVRTKWSPKQVAKRMLMTIRGKTPTDWLFNPSTSKYIYGYGMTKEKLKTILLTYTEKYGISALHLGDKPYLVSAIKQLMTE